MPLIRRQCHRLAWLAERELLKKLNLLAT